MQKFIAIVLFFAIYNGDCAVTQGDFEEAAVIKANRHLPTSSCSHLQYTMQKSILKTDYNLNRIKFQTRLKRHPNNIVTISNIKPIHDPLIELRCPLNNNKLEIYFHESRFSAESVKLFDINSIFPIHQGSINVKVKLEPIVIIVDNKSDLNTFIREIYYERNYEIDPASNKEHREEESIDDLEKEIEEIFIKRIKPDVKKSIFYVIGNQTKSFFEQNTVRF